MNIVRRGSGWEHLLEIARLEGLEKAYTWNPAVGCNGVGCEVHARGKCWAEKMAKRFGWSFEPHLIEERLKEPSKVKTSSVITPVSMGDIFGLKLGDTMAVWEAMENADWHIYALLTKLPQNLPDIFLLHDRLWFGVTVNTQEDVWRLDVLRRLKGPKKYCLFEPLYGPVDYPLDWLDLIVVGPQNYPTLQPKPEWVKSIVRNAGKTPIFFKLTLKLSLGGV